METQSHKIILFDSKHFWSIAYMLNDIQSFLETSTSNDVCDDDIMIYDDDLMTYVQLYLVCFGELSRVSEAAEDTEDIFTV